MKLKSGTINRTLEGCSVPKYLNKIWAKVSDQTGLAVFRAIGTIGDKNGANDDAIQ